MKLSKANTILIIAILLFGGVVFSSVLNPVSAQTAQPTETPTPNVIQTLQSVNATQEVQISDLEHKQNQKLDELTFEITKQVYYLAGIALFIASVVAFFGVKTYRDIDQLVVAKIKASLDREYKKQVEEADLKFLPIWIKETEVLKPVMQRLKLYDFKNLRYFNFYSQSLLNGVTVVSIENEADEIAFQRFIETHQEELSPHKAAFILYTKLRLSDKTVGIFPNLTPANMPATVGMAVINIGKTLKNISKEKEDA
jgi:hypothetical protein